MRNKLNHIVDCRIKVWIASCKSIGLDPTTSKIVDFDSKVTLDEEDNGLDLSAVIAGEKDTLEEQLEPWWFFQFLYSRVNKASKPGNGSSYK